MKPFGILRFAQDDSTYPLRENLLVKFAKSKKLNFIQLIEFWFFLKIAQKLFNYNNLLNMPNLA